MIEIHLSQYKNNAFGCGAEGEELLSFNKILIGQRSISCNIAHRYSCERLQIGQHFFGGFAFESELGCAAKQH